MAQSESAQCPVCKKPLGAALISRCQHAACPFSSPREPQTLQPVASPTQTKVIDSDATLISCDEMIEVYQHRADSIERSESYSQQLKRAVRESVRALSQFSTQSPRAITATLQLPKEVATGLRNGTLTRAGSVIRSTQSGKFAKHLKEVSPGNVTRFGKAATNAMFIAVSFAEQALLNEKLNKIQALAESTDAKLEAQQRGLLRAAFEQAATLKHLTNRENKQAKVRLIQRDLITAAATYRELYDKDWNNVRSQLEQFRTAKLWNDDHLRQLRQLSNSLSQSIEIIITCKLLHAQLHEECEEYDSMGIESAQLTEFVADQSDRFLRTFGPRSELRNEKLYKRPQYRVPFRKKRADDQKETTQLLDAHCTRMETLLSQQLLLATTTPIQEVACLPPGEEQSNPISIEEPSVPREGMLQRVKRLFTNKPPE